MKRYLTFYAAVVLVGASCVLKQEALPCVTIAKSSQDELAVVQPEISQANVKLPVGPKKAVISTELITIEAGQSLIEALRPFNVRSHQVISLASAVRGWLDLNKIAVGTKLILTLDTNHQVTDVTFGLGFAKTLNVRLLEGKWHASESSMTTHQINQHAKLKIGDSLFGSALAADIPVSIINKLILVLSYRVDFQRALHASDELEILYNADILSLDSPLSARLKPKELLYISLSVAGKANTLYLHEDEHGDQAYYFSDGRTAHSFLLKTPLNGARLSSTYGKRKHPVLGFTRIHKGLDFGAPLGTPIFATGDGKVLKASWGGSFGNRVILQHQNNYRTLYAHLQGFAQGIKSGSSVKQGQVIGFLGNTGLTQARHLHYEVHKDGRPINPLSLEFSTVANSELTKQQFTQLSRSIEKIDAQVLKARQKHLEQHQITASINLQKESLSQ
ncbi:hypothetical protein N474_15795 [Pseudoalteromonas luteoviolacea CPMOR-2]|uniref:M23ase beta-sheet core domain-containing protein n=1 Tax=Pseudoalteromonas luteoviolacea DSM 6061 TaxID=1365250 RepID=A0A166XRS2_9GAMM|nr:M23 family metallopeptidase [Pseudoalteromonas luteoviolacea]KZN40720.1 hypothetical protein N475_11370 [Pseudoalteromonas luteoviolacea DSM 6061]KZN55166.1 hypothetical protein N474_15795 [Pseudoalteromonas luteoviolacea CPMOR-2]MBE0387780.1 hypothetical protein [Pseudoalteromonas luteoviolacea DSM 6061]